MRISYDHDIDAFVSGSCGLLIERILGEERVAQDHRVFYLDTPTDRLSDAVFRYGRALTRIYDLILTRVPGVSRRSTTTLRGPDLPDRRRGANPARSYATRDPELGSLSDRLPDGGKARRSRVPLRGGVVPRVQRGTCARSRPCEKRGLASSFLVFHLLFQQVYELRQCLVMQCYRGPRLQLLYGRQETFSGRSR